MTSLSVDIVIPTLGNWELLERCLQHLQRQTKEHTTIVADGGSTDGTPENVRRLFPEVRVLELSGAGYTAGCNGGAAAGDGDVIVLLNNDAFCRPDFVERIVVPFERDERVGSVAALTLRPDEVTIDSVGITVDRTLGTFARLQGRPLAEAAAAAPLLAGPGGGADAYRRTAWEQVGGLDERLAIYPSDTDVAIRLCAAGWTTAAALDAVAIHLRSATVIHRSVLSRTLGGWGRGYMLGRYGVLRSRAAFRALVTETLVVLAELVLCRDLVALRTRVSGWRTGSRERSAIRVPSGIVDPRLTFLGSLRLRWAAR